MPTANLILIPDVSTSNTTWDLVDRVQKLIRRANQPIPTASFLKLDDISSLFDGTQTIFNITSTGNPVATYFSQNLLISLNGILQNPDIAFTTSGTTVVFMTAPTTGTQFFGALLGQAFDIGNTPLDGGGGPSAPGPPGPPGPPGSPGGGAAIVFQKLDDIAAQFNSAQTVFYTRVATVNTAPISPQNLFVSLNGVWQEPNVSYTISGPTLTFTTAPPDTMLFFGVVAVQMNAEQWIVGEILTGNVNDINNTYSTLNNFKTNSAIVYQNGLRIRQGANNDYLETTSNTIAFVMSPSTGDTLIVDYIK